MTESSRGTDRPGAGPRKKTGRRRLYEALPEEPPVPIEAPPKPAEPLGKEPEAMRIVNRYLYWSMGLSLVPVPLLEAAAVARELYANDRALHWHRRLLALLDGLDAARLAALDALRLRLYRK